MLKLIKAVFFDFDGVLSRDPEGFSRICKNMSDLTGISAESEDSDDHFSGVSIRPYNYFWERICYDGLVYDSGIADRS